MSTLTASAESQKRLTVAGWSQCGAFKQAKQALLGLQTIFPNDFHVTVQECELLSHFDSQITFF
jgi:hypothetical protein